MLLFPPPPPPPPPRHTCNPLSSDVLQIGDKTSWMENDIHVAIIITSAQPRVEAVVCSSLVLRPPQKRGETLKQLHT